MEDSEKPFGSAVHGFFIYSSNINHLVGSFANIRMRFHLLMFPLLFRGRKSFTTNSSVSEDVDHLLCGADRPLTKKVCAGKSWPPNPLPSGTVVVVGSLLR